MGQYVQVEIEPVLLHKRSATETRAKPKDNQKKKQENEKDENRRLKMRLMLLQYLFLLKSEGISRVTDNQMSIMTEVLSKKPKPQGNLT